MESSKVLELFETFKVGDLFVVTKLLDGKPFRNKTTYFSENLSLRFGYKVVVVRHHADMDYGEFGNFYNRSPVLKDSVEVYCPDVDSGMILWDRCDAHINSDFYFRKIG